MKRKLNRNKKGKLVIRGNLFETSSSSMHSFVVTKSNGRLTAEDIEKRNNGGQSTDTGGYAEDIFLTKDNLLWVGNTDSYGRAPFRILITFMDKLKYLLCAELGFMYGDEPEYDEKYLDILDAVQNIFPDVNDFYFYTRELEAYKDSAGNVVLNKNVKRKEDGTLVYKDENGNESPVYKDEDMYYEVPLIGVMNPDSVEMLKRSFEKYRLSYTEFLRNEKYVIVVDGDEYCEWNKLKKSGLINLDFIEEEA